jgi:hypothetical protein
MLDDGQTTRAGPTSALRREVDERRYETGDRVEACLAPIMGVILAER